MKTFSFFDPKFYPKTGAIPDPYLKVREQLNAELRKKCAAQEQLTLEQTVEAVVQAIKAGDFTKLVVSGTDNQQVVYLPYQGVEQLRQQLFDTRDKLERIKKILYSDENPD